MLPHALEKLNFVERFYSYSTLPSTNDTTRKLKSFPAQGIFIIQADRQTKGRGRSDTPFFSNTEGGLWISILTPLAAPDEHFIHNRALSLAICESLELAAGKKDLCKIKWPNDIFMNDKKICGILLENHPGWANGLVIGFGCNINIPQSTFPDELHTIATSLLIETGNRYSLVTILNDILQNYHYNLAIKPSICHKDYKKRLFGVGKKVTIENDIGIFEDVAINGTLCLRTESALLHKYSGHLRFL